MLLRELITRPTQVVIGLAARDRWTAIDELMATLLEVARIPAEKTAAVAQANLARESIVCPSCGAQWTLEPEVHRCPGWEQPAPWMVPEWQGDRWGIWPVFVLACVVVAFGVLGALIVWGIEALYG